MVIDILKASGQPIEGLIDDNESIEELLGFPVFHEEKTDSPIIISIGDNKIRKRISEKLVACFGKAIYPEAMVSDSADVGEGSVVMQGSLIQACAVVGKHCIVNTGASVDHDCMIGDYVHLSPHSTYAVM